MTKNVEELEKQAEANRLKLVEYFRQINLKNQNVVRIGYYIYVDGDDVKSRADIRAMLKTGNIAGCEGLKFWFNGKRKSWVWSPIPYKGKSGNKTFEELANKYGYQGDRT
jgi:hypothetical protein